MVTVTAIEHTDVRGKKLKYLKISNGTTNLLVNVGEKTYQSVKDMETKRVPEERAEAENMKLLEEEEQNKKDHELIENNNKRGGRKG